MYQIIIVSWVRPHTKTGIFDWRGWHKRRLAQENQPSVLNSSSTQSVEEEAEEEIEEEDSEERIITCIACNVE